jgi:hypothetical protein
MRGDFPSEMSLGLINESRLGSRLRAFPMAHCATVNHIGPIIGALSQAKCSFLVVVSGRLKNPEGVFVETLFVDVKFVHGNWKLIKIFAWAEAPPVCAFSAALLPYFSGFLLKKSQNVEPETL